MLFQYFGTTRDVTASSYAGNQIIQSVREIRKNPEWKKLPIIMLTAKAMKDDQERCLDAGANDYMAKPLDVEKLLSLVRVWMPR